MMNSILLPPTFLEKTAVIGLAKVNILSEKGSYLIKTANTWQEVRAALKLRHKIFMEEMLGEDRGGIDQDDFDAVCDHLLIIDKEKNLVVGTYRLNCSAFSNKFYSENEFVMADLLLSHAIKIELGRACIEEKHRNGAVISMLWRGILEYLSKTQADLLFGCATVMSQDPLEVSRLIRYLRELNVVDRKFRVVPKKKLPGVERLDLSRPLTTEEREQAQRLLPPLCSAYIKAGAKLAEIPAWDPDFRCVDFMTILEKDKISPLFLRRYGASIER